MAYETYDTYSIAREDIQNTVGWDTDLLLENKFDSKVNVNQEVKELQTNIFLKVSLKLWLINLLLDGRILEDQFTVMLEEYDNILTELINRRKEILHIANEELVSLNTELNVSKIFLAEIEKRNEIGDISEEEHLVKKRKLEWENANYRNEISIRIEVINFLENPYDIISGRKYNEMKQEVNRCQENISSLKTSDNISVNIIEKTKLSMENLVEHISGYKMAQHKQFDLRSDESNVEIKQPFRKRPIRSAIPDERDARDNPLEVLDSLDFDEAVVEKEQQRSLAVPGDLDPQDNPLKLLDSLDFEETAIEMEPPKSSEITDKHYIKNGPIEQDSKSEESIGEARILRVECPFFDVNGKKCRVVAFGTKKVEAYQKLKEHVIKNHPNKIQEFTDIIRKCIS